MRSEQRLHPISILFAFGGSLKAFALPGLGVMIMGRSRSVGGSEFQNWEFWMMLLLIPAALHAIARYLSYRVRYENTELVIRSGILFRNERHVPYARIQNLEAVRNVFHRLFGVVEVRVENAAGQEPEASISVLPLAAFEEMRRRVFEGRGAAGVATPSIVTAVTNDAAATGDARSLLRLSLRDLLLCGFIENRGMVPIAAAYGFLWEFGPLSRVWSRIVDDESAQAGLVRDVIRTIEAGQWPSLDQMMLVLVGLAGLLIFVRIVSMGWAVVRLYGFALSRAGEDLRTEYGLFTRIASTTPLSRIQTMIVRESPLHRWLGRVSIRVETAGSSKAGKPNGGMEREWLAPIIHASELPALTRHILPGLEPQTIEWQRVHPRAFRRAVKPAIVLAIALTGALSAALEWLTLAVLPFALAWFVLAAWKRVEYMRWSATDDFVVFKAGWLWRVTTVARVVKVQSVAHYQSPFDRRWAMGRVRVDTAGAGMHRIDIPYLPLDTARSLYARLAGGAASTDFRW
jgi:putative membrane protein